MSYDEGLADRIRDVVASQAGVGERQMFGGIAFLLGGKMFCGIVKDELMVRVGPDRHAEALRQPHVRPMDFTGRPMKGYVFVAPSGYESDAALEKWVSWALEFVAALPAKSPPKQRRRK
jgi:TfoX/Sxy family transcriptional regulator of competence genes